MLKELLNLKDRKILFQLDIDCRQSDSEIGKKVGLSKQTVAYRIKRLIKEGFITRFASVIDTYKLGYSKYKIYLSFENASKNIIAEITDFLVKNKKTEWIATCSGKWDLIAGYLVSDVYEFNEALKELDEKYSQFISSREVTISLGVPHWRKEYLLESKEHYPVVYQGGKKENTKIDDKDEEIIRMLVNNARMSIIDLATKLKLTPRIVNYRIKDLERKKIILVNRTFLNLNKINWIYCKALLKFKSLTDKKYKSFFNYCSGLKNLTYMINCIGSWDIELDFEIENFNEFHKIMSEIRNQFTEIIKNYDFIVVMNEDKLDYYPGAYPKLN